MNDIEKRACAWIITDDTGLSSRTLWAVMMGVTPSRIEHPHDPDDMGRCLRLLRAVPEWRARMPEMAEVSPSWAALVERWDDIEAIIRAEIGGIDPRRGARSPGGYAFMRVILDGVRGCA